jgi:hypothetical protein
MGVSEAKLKVGDLVVDSVEEFEETYGIGLVLEIYPAIPSYFRGSTQRGFVLIYWFDTREAEEEFTTDVRKL